MSETDQWPFPCPRTQAAFTSLGVVDGSDWVQFVSHDEDDGAWQFHPPGPKVSFDEIVALHLGCVLALDETLAALADLPRGWRAYRGSPTSEWVRFHPEA